MDKLRIGGKMSRKKKDNWQKEYITQSIEFSSDWNLYNVKERFEHILSKIERIPDRLYKFYAPTVENVLDLKFERLWLSDPRNFNDLYDSKLAYDSYEFMMNESIRVIILQNDTTIDTNKCFTEEEVYRLKYPYSHKKYEYLFQMSNEIDLKRRILDDILSCKSESLKVKVDKIKFSIYQKLNSTMDIVENTSKRVACFASFDQYDEFPMISQMWAHYASNHSGYCLEYDIKSLKEQVKTICDENIRDSRALDVHSKLMLDIIDSVYQVGYSSKRVRLPYRELKRISKLSREDLIQDKKLKGTIMKSFLSKSLVWKYENEWRLVMDKKIATEFDNKLPFSFLKSLYIGANVRKDLALDLIRIGESKNINVEVMSVTNGNYELRGQNANYYRVMNAKRI